MKPRLFAVASTICLAAALQLQIPAARADGMQPASSIVILYEEDGETEMNVTNTGSEPALLYTTVQDIPEDTETLVFATPPVARVEAGEEQLVRFIYQGPPLQVQRLKRVVFEGIGQAIKGDGRAVVGLGLRQNLPLLLHPKGLPRNREPWKLLSWKLQGEQLTVRNDSAYVVRLQPQVTLQPSATPVELGRTYLLPGQALTVDAPNARADTSVALHPASVYGFAVDSYQAKVDATP